MIRTLFCGAIALLLLTAAGAQAQTADTTTSGTSRAFNPALSLNALMLGHWTDANTTGGEPGEGLQIQEVELRFTSDIDAYGRANASISFADGEAAVEEVYADFLTLPAGLGLRVGRFLAPFSRENTLHTHQLPFTRRSQSLEQVFGEGWSDPGVQLSWLPELPWYTELRAAAFDASDQEWFGSENGEDLAGLARIASMFELGESTTFGVDLGAATGKNNLDDTSSLASAGLDLRWKPTRRTVYRGLRLNAEYLWAERKGLTADAMDPVDARDPGRLAGWNTYAQYQFARRWWAAARYDRFDPDGGDGQERVGVSLAFVPSEFQVVRLEFSSNDDGQENSSSVYLQYDFTIGSHPAHNY